MLISSMLCRWPDLLFARLQEHPATNSIAILNQAAGGNRILEDGLGPNVLSRLDRDILSHSGVQYVMIFEGVNDIGIAPADPKSQEALGTRLIAAYHQISTRVHARGIPIFAATLTPFGDPAVGSTCDGQAQNATADANPADANEEDTTVTPYSHPMRERTRQRVNEWIRTSGVFNAVIDFDEVLFDPREPSLLAKEYDSGDHLHPNEAAFRALAEAFPLDVFVKFQDSADEVP